MSQPDIARGFSPTDEPPSSVAKASPCSNDSEPLASEAQAILAEQVQVHTLEYDYNSRVYHLEQALDQALTCLAEMRLQIRDQSLLESQLAKTEEFSSVQQQAIARLKQQLQQQQQSLWLRDQMLLKILNAVEIQPQAEQRETFLARSPQIEPFIDADAGFLEERLETEESKAGLEFPQQLSLNLELAQPQSEAVEASLEKDPTAAKARIQKLSARVTKLEANLRQARMSLDEKQVLELTLRQTKALAAERNNTITVLQKDLAIAQIKVEELETQLAKQLKVLAKWQHNCQELEAERDRYQNRTSDLEQEIAEMQDQIFQQARKANEYETAVQHWKDRYLASQHLLVQLKDLLEQALAPSPTLDPDIDLTPALVELLEVFQMLTTTEETEPNSLSAMPSPRFNTLDVPDFLIRRRNHRAR